MTQSKSDKYFQSLKTKLKKTLIICNLLGFYSKEIEKNTNFQIEN